MNRLLRLVCLLVSCGVLRAATLPDADRIQFANGLFTRGLNDAAASEFEGFLKDSPQSEHADEAHFRLGYCYRAMGRTNDASREFQTVFDAYSNSAFRIQAGFERAMMAYEGTNYQVASDGFTAVVALGPDKNVAATALYISGECHRLLSQPAAALIEFRKIRDEFPGTDMCPYALLRVGETLSSIAGKEAEAQAAFDQLLKGPAPGRLMAEAAFQEGELLFRQHHYAESAGAYTRLLNECSNDFRVAEAQLHASWAFYHAGQVSNALARTEQALAAGGGDSRAEWLYLKANCQRQSGDRAGALTTYGVLLHDFPKDPLVTSATYELALVEYQQGQFQGVVDLASPVVTAGAADANMIWLLAEAQAGATNHAEAIRNYELLLKTFPDSERAVDTMLRLGYQCRQLNQLGDSAQWYEKASDQCADAARGAEALMAAASCRMENSQDELALALFSRHVTKYPHEASTGEALFQKAMCEIRMKQPDAGLATLKALVDSTPNSPHIHEARYWMGVIHRQAGRNADAEVAFKDALQGETSTSRWVVNARLQLAGVLQTNGKPDEAAELYQTLLGTDVGQALTPALLEWLASHWQTKLEYARAAAAARQLVQVTQDPVWLQTGWCLLGRALLATNDAAGAEIAYQQAVDRPVQGEYAPESALRLADLKRLHGDLVAASNYFSKAAEWSHDETGDGVRAHAYLGLGRTAKQAEDWPAAAKYYMSVGLLYRDPEIVPESLYEAAAIYQRLGQADAMQQALKDLRTLYPESPWVTKAAALTPTATISSSP